MKKDYGERSRVIIRVELSLRATGEYWGILAAAMG
ncbi:MAG: hypothetical protein ACI8W8_005094, partial [Rhodothermales bacterium]